MCSLYKFNQISKKFAKQEVNISLNNAKENIKDRQLFINLKEL